MDRKLLVVVLVALVIVGTWYGTASKKQVATTPTTTQPVQTQNPSVKPSTSGPIGVSGTTKSQYLSDKSGYTLYVNSKDEGQKGKIKATCDAQCEKTWLPLILDPNDYGAIGSSSPLYARINVFDRADGKRQYALGTKPLYRNVNDTKPGDVNGKVGTDWMAVRP